MITVGPFPSQLLWNVDDAHPSVLQHLNISQTYSDLDFEGLGLNMNST